MSKTPPGLDLSRVTHLAARQLVDRHFHDDEPDDPNADAIAALRKRIDAARALVREKTRAFEAEFVVPLEAEMAALEAPGQAQMEARWNAMDDALEGYGVELSDFELSDDYSGVLRCAVSGLPLMCDDETGTIRNDELFLMAVLPGIIIP